MDEQNNEQNEGFGTWAILELMGHVKLAGYVTEEQLFGTAVGRIDIPNGDGDPVTQYFGGQSIYRITPVTEQVARAFAERNQPRPVRPWELALPEPKDIEDPTDAEYYEDEPAGMDWESWEEEDAPF